MSETVDIACTEVACDHHDAARDRCRLVRPVAREGAHWLFALPGCPIASTCGELVRRFEEDDGLALRARFGAGPSWREIALRLHESQEGQPVRTIDHVVELLRSRAGDQELTWDHATVGAARAEVRVHLGADQPVRRSLWRRVARTPAGAAAWLTLVLLGALWIVGAWSDQPAAPAPASAAGALVSVSGDRELGALRPGEPFRLALEITGEVYVAVYLVPESGAVQRLFPPLGRPAGLPWPLTDAEHGGHFRIPAGPRPFVAPAAGRALIVVVPSVDAPAEWQPTLSELPRRAPEIQTAIPDARVLDLEVRTP